MGDLRRDMEHLSELTKPRANSITQRQLDASRRELYSMTSEIENYGEMFSGPQLTAMRDAMRALRKLIAALEG